MDQLNVRNVDERLWLAVKERAHQNGQPLGAFVNRILADWLHEHPASVPPDAHERASRMQGMLADIPSDRSLVGSLRELREVDRRREERLSAHLAD